MPIYSLVVFSCAVFSGLCDLSIWMTPCINTLPALMTSTMIFIQPILILMIQPDSITLLLAFLKNTIKQHYISQVILMCKYFGPHSVERLIIKKQHKKLEDNTKPLEPTVLYNRQQEPLNLKCKFENSENSFYSSS